MTEVSVLPMPVEPLTTDQALRALERLLAALEKGTLPLAVRPETAAKMLDISQKTLDTLPIKSVRLGHRTRRYPIKQLILFLEGRAR